MAGGPGAAPSAHLGPREEGRDVPHRHVPCQCLHAQVAVICQQHHLPQQPDWLLFVGGHEVLSLVFAVVEATGEDQVIIVTLEEESVRRATGQEGAPFREGTDTLLPLGSREHHIPESLPPMFWSCVVGTKSDLRDRELALLGLDGGCPPQLPEVPEHPETLF